MAVAGFADRDREPVVRKPLVLFVELLLAYEVDRGLVRREVSGHRKDRLRDRLPVGAFLEDDETFARMHVAGLEGRVFAAADPLDRFGDRVRELARVLHARNRPQRVGMAHAEPALFAEAVKAVGPRSRNESAAEHALKRKNTGIPAG